MKNTLKLSSGYTMPLLGLGTWNSEPGEVGTAIEYAIKDCGYRHIDCAHIYKNEEEIGKTLVSLLSGDIKRSEIFVTSKVWNTHHAPEDVQRACKQTLADLQLDYLDLYLIHWGIAFQKGEGDEPLNEDGKVKTARVPIQETWEAMERLVGQGLVKSIGISNFTTTMILDLLTYAKIKPAVNQIELHPYNSQQALVNYCIKEEIAVTGYSPLGTPGGIEKNDPVLLEDTLLQSIGQTHNKTTAQIALRWGIQRGTIVIPKSTNPKRIKENTEIFDFELTREEMNTINKLNRDFRFVNPDGWWGVPYFK